RCVDPFQPNMCIGDDDRVTIDDPCFAGDGRLRLCIPARVHIKSKQTGEKYNAEKHACGVLLDPARSGLRFTNRFAHWLSPIWLTHRHRSRSKTADESFLDYRLRGNERKM